MVEHKTVVRLEAELQALQNNIVEIEKEFRRIEALKQADDHADDQCLAAYLKTRSQELTKQLRFKVECINECNSLI